MAARQLSLLAAQPSPYVENQIRAEIEDISQVLEGLHHAQDTVDGAIDEVYQMSWDRINEEAQQQMVDAQHGIQDALDRLACLIHRIGDAR